MSTGRLIDGGFVSPIFGAWGCKIVPLFRKAKSPAAKTKARIKAVISNLL
jgi:hypothetical protein